MKILKMTDKSIDLRFTKEEFDNYLNNMDFDNPENKKKRAREIVDICKALIKGREEFNKNKRRSKFPKIIKSPEMKPEEIKRPIRFRCSNIDEDDFACIVQVDSSTLIAGSYSDKGLYYSEDNGKNWSQSNVQSGYFRCIGVSSGVVIAGSNSDKGLYYSEDNGKNWSQSNVQSGDFLCIGVSSGVVIAGSYSGKGLYYSEDNGKNWSQSNVQSGNFWCIGVSSGVVIAGSGSGKGLYYSEDCIE